MWSSSILCGEVGVLQAEAEVSEDYISEADSEGVLGIAEV